MKSTFCIALAGIICLTIQSHGLAQDNKAYKVKVIRDIAYYNGKDADPDKHKLDIYLPKGKKDFQVLFFIHGGGWRKGSRKKFAKLAKTFAGHGIGTVAASYRLSPKVRHPAHIEDVAKAFAWTHDNIGKYGGNKKQIFVSGHSAGGHLSALLATDASRLGEHHLGLKDIQGCIPVSGVFSLIPGKREDVFGKDPEAIKQASPITHVSSKCPPFMILYAEKDGKGFDKMAADFADALKEQGVSATVHEMKDRTHGSIVGMVPNEGDPTRMLILEFIRENQ